MAQHSRRQALAIEQGLRDQRRHLQRLLPVERISPGRQLHEAVAKQGVARVGTGGDRQRIVPEPLRQRQRRPGARQIVLARRADGADRGIGTPGQRAGQHELCGSGQRTFAGQPGPITAAARAQTRRFERGEALAQITRGDVAVEKCTLLVTEAREVETVLQCITDGRQRTWQGFGVCAALMPAPCHFAPQPQRHLCQPERTGRVGNGNVGVHQHRCGCERRVHVQLSSGESSACSPLTRRMTR
ncbi:MAG: hypothetical protein CAPSK01_002424 [Candidatus Accumulibacter vicinus]|uniref:Uncharacterized protein n=1 Tax=Candidatus Accumulibacter vicinus TaxID=2954382 RepID=A0A084XZE2_9PROT|nr:MAG: hypothetical protein CAPSK01_002424 [Candidatus Accumulibacter vicinus]